MGCASSTPMIATAGSDILKAATHAASDATKSAENAIEDVAETVGKTFDSAKESVGTAVTGIAHDLGNVFTEKSGELDSAKNQLLERLHLGGGGGATKAIEHASEATANQLDTQALEAAARAPTPPPDLDSLKTTTPEPEIERAMANSHEENTPPTPKPTIAELEKLKAEVKQTAQTTTASSAATTAVTESVVGAKHALAETSNGTTAATEPAVDMISWLAAEKRPSTTEWEKHADHLSKTRKMNEFKGGGKYRRFGPPIPSIPPKQHSTLPKPTESINMKRLLLEDDSCFSDAYYNSDSSPTNSDSAKLRRARLPINGVLATNAKRMQREFATFVSNRRSKASALRSLTVSPAPGRRFDYNPQRARITSPTPSVIAYTRPGYGIPVVEDPELQLYSRTANRQRGAHLTSPPSHGVRAPRPIVRSDSPLAANVITISKLKPTKAFAPLRGETTGRSRIFGQTRSGSPVNRRVFAKRSVSPRVDEDRRLGSPERTRALVQGKVEAGREKQGVAKAQTTSTIKLERKASVKEGKESVTGAMIANGFTLSKALTPIKMVANSHSLPHLTDKEKKSMKNTAHSMLEVVEKAVESAKDGGLSRQIDMKVPENKQREVSKGMADKNSYVKETPKKSQKPEMTGEQKLRDKKENAEAKRKMKNMQSSSENNINNMDGGSSSSKTQTPTSARSKHRSRSTDVSQENGNNCVRQRSSNTHQYKNDRQRENFAMKGRFSMSPIKTENLTYTNIKKRAGNGVNSARLNSKKEQISNNRNHSNTLENNWISSSRTNSEIEYTNINNQFGNRADLGIRSKESDVGPRSARTPSKRNGSSVANQILQTQSRVSENSSETSNEMSSKNSCIIYKPERLRFMEKDKVYINNNTKAVNEENKNHEINNNAHKLLNSTNRERVHTKSVVTNGNQQNINGNNDKRILKSDNLTNLPTTTTTTSTLTKNARTASSPNQSSHNSSPSKSSKSSTSIVIGTHLFTSETELDNEVTLNAELVSALQKFKQPCEEVDEENISPNSYSVEETSQNELEDSLHTEHEDSSHTDYEDAIPTDIEMKTSFRPDVDILSASSLEDLINQLSPQTAYLNLGRSATMMTLRSTQSLLNAPCSFRSTPRASPCRERHKSYSSYESDQQEKVPFVADFSSVARSRSPQVPLSPYKIRLRCGVCYNKYVID